MFNTARRFNMEVQPQLVLLQKTLFNIEGLGRRLYPDLNLWDTAKPFLETWTREQMGPRAFLRALRKEMPKWSQALPQLPLLMHDLLQKGSRGELSVHWKSADLEKLRSDLRANHRRLLSAVVGGSLVISAALLSVLGAATPGWLGLPLFSWLCGAAGGALLLLAWPGKNSPCRGSSGM